MDPNKLLSDLLNHAKSFLALDGDVADPVALDAFCQALLDLDSWLTRGGFLPDRWQTPAMAESRRVNAAILGSIRDHDSLQKAIQETEVALQALRRAFGDPV